MAYYNLDMILALGFRVRSPVGVRFRQWANDKLKEYIIKGFVLDDQRSDASLSALAELAKKTQVILFTHHSQIVEQARRLEGNQQVHIHNL